MPALCDLNSTAIGWQSIREFNPSNQRTYNSSKKRCLLPMKEFSLKGSSLDDAVRRLDQRALELEVDRREKNRMLESVREGIPFPGIEFLVPYFCASLASVFSYLPRDTLVWLDGADRVEAEAERFGRLVWDRHQTAKEEHRLVAPVETLYLNEHEWRAALQAFSQVHCEALSIMAASERAQASTLTVESYLTSDLRQETALHGKDASLAPLIDRLKSWQGEKVIFVAPTKGDAARLSELLANYDFQLPVLEELAPAVLARSDFSRAIMCGHLHQSFRLPEAHIVFVTFDEIFGTRKHQPAPSQSHPSHFLTSLSELKQDDFVVHLDHGIGIYRGLKFLKVAGVEGEFLHLEYSGGDRMYLPVDRINMVQKYIGGDGAQPALDRLGGTAWEKVKAKARKSMLAMAEDLGPTLRPARSPRGHRLRAAGQPVQGIRSGFRVSKKRPTRNARSMKHWRACRVKNRWIA